jgi:hypothetical protein
MDFSESTLLANKYSSVAGKNIFEVIFFLLNRLSCTSWVWGGGGIYSTLQCSI